MQSGMLSSRLTERALNQMVNASLNWASLCGIFIGIYAIPASVFSLIRLYFAINRRADASPVVITRLITNLIQALGRFSLLICGGILFFQGWRLDPILQFGVFLLAVGVVVESVAAVASDCQEWRQRVRRAEAVIAVAE